jgi:predicted enzyme related to lactoylglutathione lyase
VRIDSVAYHVQHLDAAARWFEQLGATVKGELSQHGRYLDLGGLCIELSTRWTAGAHGDPYFTVDDLDALHVRCVERGVQVLSPPHDTGDDARLMELAGPDGLRLYVISYPKK